VVVNLTGRRSSKAVGDVSVIVAVSSVWKERRGRRWPPPLEDKIEGVQGRCAGCWAAAAGLRSGKPISFFFVLTRFLFSGLNSNLNFNLVL
jgi:hypothetical protein